MRLVRAALALVLLACGGASAPAPRTTTAPRPDRWSRLSWDDRHDLMTFLVLPNMAPLFQREQRHPFPDMTCRTCHGQDAEAVHYAMPHGLPALDPAHMPDRRSSDPKVARMAAFMADEVTPRMAAMLGKPDLGCFDCHTKGGAR